MTTETILTDAEIITIGQQARAVEPGKNGYILPVTFARAIEQAVLQSEQVQAWKRDAERYRWLRDPCSGAEHVVMYGRGDYGKGLKSGSTLDDNIDAAMEQKT